MIAAMLIKGIIKRITKSSGQWQTFVLSLKNLLPSRDVTVSGSFLGQLTEGMAAACYGEFSNPGYFNSTEIIPRRLNIAQSTLVALSHFFGNKVSLQTLKNIANEHPRDALYAFRDTPEAMNKRYNIAPAAARHYRKKINSCRASVSGILTACSVNLTEKQRDVVFTYLGDMTSDTLNRHPYRLAHLPKFDFALADMVARQMGFNRNSKERIVALFECEMASMEENGSTIISRDDVVRRIATITGVSNNEILKHLRSTSSASIVRSSGRTPYFSSRSGGHIETKLSKELYRLSQGRQIQSSLDLEHTILYQAQKDAVINSVRYPLSVITGGPGVGKTTTVNEVVKNLSQQGLTNIVQCAPTGKAAQRMTESTGMKAVTIHRLLDFKPGKGFRKNRSEPIEADVIIVDEASMIDVHLAHALLSAIKSTTKLIFVGDTDQISSVGPGNVLGDMIRSSKIPTTVLNEVRRVSGNSDVIPWAHRFNSAKLPDIDQPSEDCHFIEVQSNNDVSILNQTVALVRRLLSEGRAAGDIQALCAQAPGPSGYHAINKAVRPFLNPDSLTEPAVDYFGVEFCKGDRIMQTKNDYTLGVMNGDVGKVLGIQGKELICQFGEREVILSFKAIGKIVHAYACTIHKSQGSEYASCIMISSDSHQGMTPELLYTGITRTRKEFFLVGSRSSLYAALKRPSKDVFKPYRSTLLHHCLTQDFPKELDFVHPTMFEVKMPEKKNKEAEKQGTQQMRGSGHVENQSSMQSAGALSHHVQSPLPTSTSIAQAVNTYNGIVPQIDWDADDSLSY